MPTISRAIKPEEWFPKNCHISIELNGNFNINNPFKNIKYIDPRARSVQIRISSGFNRFGPLNALKYLREVIQCVGSDIEWIAIEMNTELATDYLDVCARADILQNISGLAIQITGDKYNLKSYHLDREYSKLKTLSLHNCSVFIANIENWPSLEKLSICEKRELIYEPEIANFIRNNKQLKSLNIESCGMQLNRIAMAFVDGLHDLQELRIHTVYLSFFLDRHYRNLKKLRNISRLEINDLQFPNPESKYEATRAHLVLDDFAICLSSIDTLKNLTISLSCNPLQFNCAAFSNSPQLTSLALSAYHINSEDIMDLVGHSKGLTSLHLHSYDGEFPNIPNIAHHRGNSPLKNQKLNLFVGGNNKNVFQYVKNGNVKKFVNVFKCTDCVWKDSEIGSDDPDTK